MTALTKDFKVADKLNPEDSVQPLLLAFPMAAATTIFAGAIVCTDAAGNAVSGASATAVKVWGRCETQVVNAGAAGALFVTVRPGVFAYNNSAGGDALAAADIGNVVYVVDDNVVAKTAGAGRIPAGIFYGLDPVSLRPFVGLGFASPYTGSAAVGAAGTVSTLVAKNVVLTNVASLAAYTVSGGDGNTNVAGDVVLLVGQTVAAQNGPYVVGTVTTGTAALTRLGSVPTGLTVADRSLNVVIQSGTIGAESTWGTTATGVVNTNDLGWFPRIITQPVTLVAGTLTVTNVPILSATKTNYDITRITPVGTALTVAYNPATITAGPIGTASLIINAQIAAGTINTADGSALILSVINY